MAVGAEYEVLHHLRYLKMGSMADNEVPFGTSTTLNIALTDGGPVTILYGVRLSPCIKGQIAER